MDNYEPEDYNEYNDQDATDCANGDYNTFEENQLAMDNEGDEPDRHLDDYGDMSDYYDNE